MVWRDRSRVKGFTAAPWGRIILTPPISQDTLKHRFRNRFCAYAASHTTPKRSFPGWLHHKLLPESSLQQHRRQKTDTQLQFGSSGSRLGFFSATVSESRRAPCGSLRLKGWFSPKTTHDKDNPRASHADLFVVLRFLFTTRGFLVCLLTSWLMSEENTVTPHTQTC